MPLYLYDCPAGHQTEKLRCYHERDAPTSCACGAPARRVLSPPHCVPDGMYSYAPNLGSEAAFERRRHAARNGVRLIDRSKELPQQ